MSPRSYPPPMTYRAASSHQAPGKKVSKNHLLLLTRLTSHNRYLLTKSYHITTSADKTKPHNQHLLQKWCLTIKICWQNNVTKPASADWQNDVTQSTSAVMPCQPTANASDKLVWNSLCQRIFLLIYLAACTFDNLKVHNSPESYKSQHSYLSKTIQITKNLLPLRST